MCSTWNMIVWARRNWGRNNYRFSDIKHKKEADNNELPDEI